MNEIFEQASKLYQAALPITSNSLQILVLTRDILSQYNDGFKKANIDTKEFNKNINSARFSLLMKHYDDIIALPLNAVKEYDFLVDKIANLRDNCSLSDKQQDIVNEKSKAKFFNLAQRRAKSWLDSNDNYSRLSVEISHVYTALASAGLADISKTDIFYDPALSQVGLSPEVVDKKLKESVVFSLTEQVVFLNNKNVPISLWPDMLDHYIETLEKVNYSWDQWLIESSFDQDVLEKLDEYKSLAVA
jgi:hypothetical protein